MTPQRRTPVVALLLRTLTGLFLPGLCTASAPLPVAAQLTLMEGERTSLELGGYIRTLTGLYDLGYDLPGTERTSGFNAEVVRLKWNVRLGDRAILEVHDRIQAQVSSSATALGSSVAGFGVSVVPDRWIDLTTDLVEKEGLRAWHDVDRLSLTLYSGFGDLTVGRQAVTWGISNLFPVSDLWARFSPFELDTEEKPGIDAVRLLSYPGSGMELDVVVADRGRLEDISAGARAGFTRSWGDLYLGGGKFWNQGMVLGGVAAPLGSWKLRAEAVLPYDLDENEMPPPRLTAGMDWFGGETMVSGEYHFNGIGAADPDDYGEVLQDPRLGRGESYFLGRHYLGGLFTWTPGNDRLTLTLSALTNLQDPSANLTPAITYDFGQNTRASVGGMLSVGDAPQSGTPPRLNSEYGTYGDLLFSRISIYF